MPRAEMSRVVPRIMLRPYPVIGPDGERLGMVEHPEQVAKLLAGDPAAGVCQTRRGFVQLGDIDSWFCLPKLFTPQTYLPQSYTITRRAASGRRYVELRSSSYCLVGVR